MYWYNIEFVGFRVYVLVGYYERVIWSCYFKYEFVIFNKM